MKKNKKLLFIVIGILLIIAAIIVFVIISSNKKSDTNDKANNYNFSKETIELPGTQKYENDVLKEEHCLNDVCISGLVFYYNDTEGRVEYNITNKSNSTQEGYLKMIFDNQELIVYYSDLNASETIKSTSQYVGMKINNMNDYRLEKLSEEEIKSIRKK